MSGKVPIALVTTELAVGGAERCLANLAVGLGEGRFEPHVYALAPPPPAQRAQLVAQLQRAAIPTTFLGLRSVWSLPLAVRRLRRELLRQQPRLIQSFLFHANVVAGLASRGMPATRIAGVRVADPRRWRHQVERWMAGRQERIVCVSDAVRDFCRDQVRLPADKLQVIPNGIAVADDPPPAVDVAAIRAAAGLPIEGCLLISVGRLDRQKGLDWLLESLPPLLAARPEAHLVLVGDGPESTRLQQLVETQGLSGRVRFLGWRDDVSELLAASDLLLLPSRWEGMPNAVLEAMAAGRAVLASRAEGVLQLLGERADEQTFAFGDVRGFSERLIAMVENASRRAELGQANRRRARDSFSLAAMVAQYESLYASYL